MRCLFVCLVFCNETLENLKHGNGGEGWKAKKAR